MHFCCQLSLINSLNLIRELNKNPSTLLSRWFLRTRFSPRLSTKVNPHLSRKQVHAEGRILTDTHPTCVKDKSKFKIKLIKPVYSETCSMGTLAVTFASAAVQRCQGVYFIE